MSRRVRKGVRIGTRRVRVPKVDRNRKKITPLIFDKKKGGLGWVLCGGQAKPDITPEKFDKKK